MKVISHRFYIQCCLLHFDSILYVESLHISKVDVSLHGLHPMSNLWKRYMLVLFVNSFVIHEAMNIRDSAVNYSESLVQKKFISRRVVPFLSAASAPIFPSFGWGIASLGSELACRCGFIKNLRSSTVLRE